MESKLKHLEFIQAVINRMAGNSFLLKGWSVVLVSALFALSASDSDVSFIMFTYIPAVAFWGLDGYFLGQERVFREHYDRVRIKPDNEIDFSMDVSDIPFGRKEWISATLSKTLLLFHGAILASIIVVMLIYLIGNMNG